MTQKNTAKFIYSLTMMRGRRSIIGEFGKDFWNQFKGLSDCKMKELIQEFPDIGPSMFAFNYAYAPGYVAWWTSMEKLGLPRHECEVWMLKLNEKMLLTIPKFLLHYAGKIYYKNMSQSAKKRMEHQPEKLHPFDWDITYREYADGNFDIDILSCGFIAYTAKYGGSNMLPAICQVDYLISHYMNVGFERTQTLGNGKEKCDCKYRFCGQCQWDMEQRLEERK